MTDIQLIADNFALISEKTDNLAAVFYQRFFGKHPELEDLFTNNPAPQQQMLNETLTAVVDHLEDAGWVKTNMEALGLRHQSYEISDEMYDWWIDVLSRPSASSRVRPGTSDSSASGASSSRPFAASPATDASRRSGFATDSATLLGLGCDSPLDLRRPVVPIGDPRSGMPQPCR
jgi:hypothetical protein